MTTAQTTTNGHRVLPCDHATGIVTSSSGESRQQDELSPVNSSGERHGHRELSPVNNDLQPEAIPALPSQIPDLPSPDAPPASTSNSYHVPPARFAPKPNAYRQDDTLDLPVETSPLPERCQFMFSDGRQCTMARSDIHPSLCRFHAEREDQLFGDPAPGGAVVGRGLDLPELYSACADLSTAAGVSRALAQVFRLLAQRRISRQEAATFAKLGHLLLQSIRAARAESAAAPLGSLGQHEDGVILSEHRERRISPRPAPEREVSPAPRATPSSVNQIEPPPREYVMKPDPLADTSTIFCRPAMPAMNEERFVLSGSAENRHVRRAGSQPTQNEHLQNVRT